LNDDKYRIILIYLVEDGGSYGGGYYEPFTDLMGAVGVDSIDVMVNEAYESLKQAMEIMDEVPFDINNIKESVVFDLVECQTENEMDTAHTLLNKQGSFEEIKAVVLK